MSPYAMSIVSSFEKLPSTPEKEEIARKYVEDEVGIFEFLSLANDYCKKIWVEAL